MVEGNTDYKLMDKLKELYESKVNIEIVNAKSGTKILKKYKSLKKEQPERRVIVLYDLDAEKTVEDIRREYKKEGLNLKKEDLYFVNPKIEFLLILWKKKCAYTIVSDRDYQKKIEEVYKVKNYKKTETQLNKIMREITKENIEKTLEYIKELNLNRNSIKLPSTNFDKLFEELFYLEKPSLKKENIKKTKKCV